MDSSSALFTLQFAQVCDENQETPQDVKNWVIVSLVISVVFILERVYIIKILEPTAMKGSDLLEDRKKAQAGTF